MNKSNRTILIIFAAIAVLLATCTILYFTLPKMLLNLKPSEVAQTDSIESTKDTSWLATEMLMPYPQVDSTAKPLINLQFTDYVISDTTYNYVFCEEDILRTYFFYHEMEFPIASSNPAILKKIQKDLISQLYVPNKDGITCEMEEPKIVGDLWTCPLKKEQTSYSSTLTPYDTTVWDTEYRYFHHYCGRSWAFSSRTWTYVVEYVLYFGGTHGVDGRYYICYDLSTGKQLKIEDILEGNYKNDLNSYMVNWLTNYELNVKHEEKAMFDKENVVPNDEFYIDNAGITFYFKNYSISCYAISQREIPVPKELLKPYLKPDWKNLWD